MSKLAGHCIIHSCFNKGYKHKRKLQRPGTRAVLHPAPQRSRFGFAVGERGGRHGALPLRPQTGKQLSPPSFRLEGGCPLATFDNWNFELDGSCLIFLFGFTRWFQRDHPLVSKGIYH